MLSFNIHTILLLLSQHVVVKSFIVPSKELNNIASLRIQQQQRLISSSSRSLIVCSGGKIGLFFGTSTGSTQTVAELIAEEFGDDVIDGPFDVDESMDPPVSALFKKYDSLIVGTPTWNTGADSERSGTGWDEIYYSSMAELDLGGKKVAVFGLGDQVSYSENYADATGELHDVFENLGCTMLGYTSQEGYEHEASKSIRGDKFCGLLCDMVNQEDLTEERVKNWVEQLKGEGILEGGSAAPAAAPAAEPFFAAPVEPEPEPEPEPVPVAAAAAAATAPSNGVASPAPAGGYKAHYNPKTGKTMWTSSDGRKCYFTP